MHANAVTRDKIFHFSTSTMKTKRWRGDNEYDDLVEAESKLHMELFQTVDVKPDVSHMNSIGCGTIDYGLAKLTKKRSTASRDFSCRTHNSKETNRFNLPLIVGNGDRFVEPLGLLDTGAVENSVKCSVIRDAGLDNCIYDVKGKWFTLADGSSIYRDKMVDLDCLIAGVWNRISFYVDDSNRRTPVLFGMPGINAFLCELKPAFGRYQNWKLTVAQNKTRMRAIRYVVPEARPVRPSLKLMGRKVALERSRRQGKTTKELQRAMGQGRSSSKDAADFCYGKGCL